MQTFLATLIVMGLAFLGMALGVIAGRRRSSCACKAAESLMARATRRRRALDDAGTPSTTGGPSLEILSQGCGDCRCGNRVPATGRATDF